MWTMFLCDDIILDHIQAVTHPLKPILACLLCQPTACGVWCGQGPAYCTSQTVYDLIM